MEANFFYKAWKTPGACMETFCRITMQLPLFQLKLKTFPLLHHRDHSVFTRKFLKVSTLCTLVEKKRVPCKDLARFSFKVLQDNAFFCKTSCKNLARKTISLQDSSKEKNFVEGSPQFFSSFIFIVSDFKLTTAS